MMKIFIGILMLGVVIAKQKQCGQHAHFTDCGPACPVTCDNRDNPSDACIMMCVPGCHCDEGFVKTSSGRCVKPQNCPKTRNHAPGNCVDKPDKGVCRARRMMWYFDQSNGSCQQFVYGGCGGNGNRYKTEAECMDKCKETLHGEFHTQSDLTTTVTLSPGDAQVTTLYPETAAAEVCGENERYSDCGTACPLTCDNYDNPPQICPAMCKIGCECEEGFVTGADGKCVKPEQCPKTQTKPEEIDCTARVDPGVCDAFMPRYFYDPAEELCKEFIYGGCGGNTNNFKTEEECKTTCGAPLTKSYSACLEDKKVGSCKAAFARYFFNMTSVECESFIYGGCEGNSNNFNSKEDCEAVCL